jgi:transcriptional regulator with XRE-family HTH domain
MTLVGMARVSGLREKSSALIALGAVIRQRRKQLDFSQEVLADASGIDRSHMGKIERGERNVTVLNVLRIAKALRTSACILFTEAGI